MGNDEIVERFFERSVGRGDDDALDADACRRFFRCGLLLR